VTATIGDPQVRNWGTIGGSVAHADPASDWPAVLLATSATIICRSQSGDRAIAARDFFLDTFTTAIEPTEVLTEIRIGRRPRGSGAAYQKLERKVGDFATVGVAAVVRLGAGSDIESAGIGVTGVAETPFAATDAEAILAGNAPSEELFRRAAAAAAAQSRPAGDVRGPVEYKRAMVAELTIRALRTAVERALANA
jgi:carbon-monoxide dehydrogenase medium subunit